jgi:hypothetical protein
MNWIIALESASLFFAGILAGMEVVIHYGLRRPSEVLDSRSQIQLRQALVVRLRLLVPAFFAPTALSGFGATVLGGVTPALWWRCGAMGALLVWVVIRVIGAVPINKATLAWDPAAPPGDWKGLIDHAERFHSVGVWAATLAFALLLVAQALQPATP